MFKPSCLPILIGSLPLDDHQEAVLTILSHTPDLPLWPQLPNQPREGMVRQFISGFPGLVDKNGKYWVAADHEHFAVEMTSFYEEYIDASTAETLTDTSRFSLGPDTAKGFFVFIETLEQNDASPVSIKGQITGPMTVGIGVKDHNGNSIFYDDNLRDILIKLLTLKARWQVERLRRFTTSIPPIIFIDEPGIVSFGSTAYTSVTRQMVTEAVNEVITGIRTAGGIAGVHICANGDWDAVLRSHTDIISFDAYSFFDNFILYHEQLFEYLSREGILAWGIIPTGDLLAIEQESVDSLYSKWIHQLKQLALLGFSERQLAKQTLIAPSCGTGSLSKEHALKVLSMTSELSKKIRSQFDF